MATICYSFPVTNLGIPRSLIESTFCFSVSGYPQIWRIAEHIKNSIGQPQKGSAQDSVSQNFSPIFIVPHKYITKYELIKNKSRKRLLPYFPNKRQGRFEIEQLI